MSSDSFGCNVRFGQSRFSLPLMNTVQLCSYDHIDAAHLKGSSNGVILALSFKNLNINVVHVASAVCPKENADV